MNVRLTLTEPALGTTSNNPDLHREFVASKAPDAKSVEQEVEAIGADAFADRSMTIFPKNDGVPFFWDYQIKGFFKDACSMLTRVPGTASKELKAWRKIIDGLIFVNPRQIPMDLHGGKITTLQRPIRVQTPQGERVALAESEMVPAGTTLDFEIVAMDDKLFVQVREWLDYGKLRGLGQWRNASWGRFTWEEVKK